MFLWLSVGLFVVSALHRICLQLVGVGAVLALGDALGFLLSGFLSVLVRFNAIGFQVAQRVNSKRTAVIGKLDIPKIAKIR